MADIVNHSDGLHDDWLNIIVRTGERGCLYCGVSSGVNDMDDITVDIIIIVSYYAIHYIT